MRAGSGKCRRALLILAGLMAAPAAGEGLYLGFADSTGTRVIVTARDTAGDPGFLWAVLPSGETVALSYCERAAGTDGNNYRDVASNFDNLPGAVYRVAEDPLAADETCPLATSGFLSGRTPLAVGPLDMSPLGEAEVQRIEAARDMDLDRSWRLADIGGEAEVWLGVFEPGDSTIVASMILCRGGDLFFEDYVGAVSEDMQSVWRVDDGGRFGAEYFEIIAAFGTAEGIELIRTWIGAEGENAAWLRPEGGKLVPGLTGYRYQSPL